MLWGVVKGKKKSSYAPLWTWTKQKKKKFQKKIALPPG